MESCIPQSTKIIKSKKPSWFNKSCNQAQKEKNSKFQLYRNNDCLENHLSYIKARNHYKTIINSSKQTFDSKIRNKIMSFPNNSKSFWSLTKLINQNFSNSLFPSLVTPHGSVISSSYEKAELFAQQFATNSTINPPNTQLPSIPKVNSRMRNIKFKSNHVHEILSKLKTNKATGPDQIPAIVLKKCAHELSPVLTKLFQTSHSLGVFPSSWKIANIFPIPKKGSRKDPNNYRPIALLSVISKVMEKYINIHILKYLESHNIIHDRQYGFRTRRSTADLLTYVTHLWNQSLERHGESLIVALDVSKAFDQVWHQALLNKLPSYGFPQKFCAWVANFLSNRYISVIVDGSQSKSYPINAGVPQGSVLSSTLFLLHINDLLNVTKKLLT